MRSAALRAQLESALGGRWPSPFTFRERPRTETVSSGIAPTDSLTGAGRLPRGALTESFGPDSSGRTSLLLSLLAQMTAREEACALVDSTDAFDPLSAEAAGVDLRRLLWVRCARAGIRDSGLRLPIADCRLPIENRRLHLLQSAIVNRKSAIPRPEPRVPNPDIGLRFDAGFQVQPQSHLMGGERTRLQARAKLIEQPAQDEGQRLEQRHRIFQIHDFFEVKRRLAGGQRTMGPAARQILQAHSFLSQALGKLQGGQRRERLKRPHAP